MNIHFGALHLIKLYQFLPDEQRTILSNLKRDPVLRPGHHLPQTQNERPYFVGYGENRLYLATGSSSNKASAQYQAFDIRLLRALKSLMNFQHSASDGIFPRDMLTSLQDVGSMTPVTRRRNDWKGLWGLLRWQEILIESRTEGSKGQVPVSQTLVFSTEGQFLRETP